VDRATNEERKILKGTVVKRSGFSGLELQRCHPFCAVVNHLLLSILFVLKMGEFEQVLSKSIYNIMFIKRIQ